MSDRPDDFPDDFPGPLADSFPDGFFDSGDLPDDMAGALDAGEPPPHYALSIITVTDHAPLLARPRLARAALDALVSCAGDAPGSLWGALALPDALRWIAGPADEVALATFVEHVKARTAARLLPIVQRADDDSLDAVLRYSPVWGGAIYQVWDAGSHRVRYYTEYRLSNALYELWQTPVTLGLAADAGQWPFRWPPAE